MTQNRMSTFLFARRTLALTALLSAGWLGVQAQQGSSAVKSEPTLNLDLPKTVSAEEATFSSSADNQVAMDTNRFDFVNAMQPAPRKYGRPRYRGGNTNADGSNKYAFLVGGGFTQPVGNTHHYLTPSFGFQVGGGRNFNRMMGVVLQFDWDNFGFAGRTLASQTFVYNTIFGANAVRGLDGNSHVWSFTLNPTFNVIPAENGGMGMYVVLGTGFYHKTANFFVPSAGLCYDQYYGGYYQCAANQTIDKYTSNGIGFNGGVGFTYKVSRFSGQRLYAEARYVFVDNQKRNGITAAIAAPTAAQQAATNFFPANSNRTGYFPVKFGIRF